MTLEINLQLREMALCCCNIMMISSLIMAKEKNIVRTEEVNVKKSVEIARNQLNEFLQSRLEGFRSTLKKSVITMKE